MDETASVCLRILLVDDDEVDRQQAKRLLQQANAQVVLDEATNSSNARLLLERQAYDAVLLDYRLPGEPSCALLPHLQRVLPDAAVLVMTGHGDEELAVQLMKAGISDYLPKDKLKPQRLWRALQHAVKLRRAERDARRADAIRRRHAARLRTLVESAPAIAGSLTLGELARASSDNLRNVLTMNMACTLLIDEGERHVFLSTDQPFIALAEKEAWEQACSAGAHALTPERYFLGPGGSEAWLLGLRSHDGRDVGCLAIGTGQEDEDEENQTHLYCQFGQLISGTRDTLALHGAATRALQARNDVLSVVSHDLRGPLSNLRLGLEALRGRLPSATEDAILERIDRNAKHMTRLVDDLVDMARIEGGGIELTRTYESVESLFSALAQGMLPAVEAARLQWRAVLRNDVRVFVDRHRLMQVFFNLVGNAIKFTPPGGSVEIGAHDEERQTLFWVRDTGEGIPAHEAVNVFRRFWKTNVGSAPSQGLGLGLFIAKGMVEAHGGHIWFESLPGHGTTFRFLIPKYDSTSWSASVGKPS